MGDRLAARRSFFPGAYAALTLHVETNDRPLRLSKQRSSGSLGVFRQLHQLGAVPASQAGELDTPSDPITFLAHRRLIRFAGKIGALFVIPGLFADHLDRTLHVPRGRSIRASCLWMSTTTCS